ncbi:hypothetical protein LTR85_007844 [Meristemomyces frigidus]|nr:hypothetical protein LTR85_007844 [Meristemomyces frigidus]
MSQPLIKPNQIDGLPFLDASKKEQYKNGLAQLWQQHDTNAQGSPARVQAETKIRTASTKLMQELAAYRNSRPASGGGPQQRPPTQGSMSAQQGGAPPQGGQANGQPGGQISNWVKGQLANITIHMPPNMAPANHPQYKQRWYAQAVQELTRKENAGEVGRRLQSRIQGISAQGQAVPPEMTQQLEAARRAVQEVDAKWGRMKMDNENKGNQNRQALQQAAGQAQQPAQQQPQPNGAQAQGMQRSNTFQGNNAQGDVKQEPRTSISPPQAQANFQQQPQQPVNQATPAPNVQNMGQQPSSQQPQHTPQTVTQPQPPQNFPQQQQPQQQPYPTQQRPPMNPQLSQTQIPQHQQTPASAIPQSATQQQPQRPQALSQQAAMAQAAQSYQNQQQMPAQQQQQQQQINQPQVPNSLPFNVPGSATQPTPTSGFPPQQQQQQQQQPPSMQSTQTPNNKFPIAKQLQIDPRISQPVQGPPARPTLANSGMLQQPGLTRPAAYTLEGEGDRVLSKRKLDELVRQVTGGGSASNDDNAFLAPEVEHSLLHLADDFIDTVITSACKIAKLRPTQTLELKDIQIVLERNYGIRVPGYALEEVRAVKRFQPTVEWQKKMQAIQTSKTLGGVGKGDS